MSDYILYSVKENETGMRLDQFLATMDQIVSRTQAQRLLKSGNVLLNGVSVSAPSRKVYSGQSIQLTVPDNEPSEIAPEKGDLEILYEDFQEHVDDLKIPSAQILQRPYNLFFQSQIKNLQHK